MASFLLIVGTVFEVVISAKLFRHQKIVKNLPTTKEVVANTHNRFAIAIFTDGENVCSGVLGIGGHPNSKLSSRLKAISSKQTETHTVVQVPCGRIYRLTGSL